MKTLLLLILGLATFGTFAQNVNIPDANFKAYLVGNAAINTNGDTEIQVSEASSFTGQLFCDFLSISDLTGIEAFINITDLVCSSNQLTSLDVSQNTALEYLDCQFNQIASLDVSQLPALDYLRCRSNNLTMLDVSSNPLLEILICQENQIGSLDLSSNPALVTIASSDNQLTSFNVSNGNNTSITGFWTTNNPNLTCIQVDDATYSTNNWTNVDPGASFSTSCGPCTVTIPDANFKAYLVGNASINTNGDTEIQCSEASSFTGLIGCSNLSITDLTGIEAFTEITALYCNNNFPLSNLDVTNCTELEQLHCNNNGLTSLDISQNPALTNLVCYSNSLTSLDVTNNTLLTELHCYSQSINSLDVSQNTALTVLACQSNPIGVLDVSQNTGLLYLSCHTNSLSNLDVSQNIDLEDLNCGFNSLIDLDLSQNINLVDLRCDNNTLTNLNVSNGNNLNVNSFNAVGNPNLTCIQVDDAAYSTTNWTSIDAGASFSTNCGPCTVNIPDVNFKNWLVNNPQVNTNGDNEIQCSEANSYTGILNFAFQSVADLTGIEQFVLLDTINCSNNLLSSLDFSSNTALKFINCGNNTIDSIDVSINTQLTEFACNNNSLVYLNVANGTNTQMPNFYAQNNPNLSCIQVDDAAWSTTNWVFKDASASFSENCSGGIGVEEELLSQFSISPNPARSTINIQSELAVQNVSIRNTLGQIVLETTGQKIDISTYPNGVYLITMSTEKGIITKRFIKE